MHSCPLGLRWLSVALLLGLLPARGPARGTEPDIAWFTLSPAVSDGAVTVSLDFTSANIQGWSLSLCHDPGAVKIARFGWSEELSTIRGGYPPDFYVCEVAREPSGEPGAGTAGARAGIVQAVILSNTERLLLPHIDGGFPILNVEYEVLSESMAGVCNGLRGRGQPVSSLITIDGQTYEPSTEPAVLMVQKPYARKLSYKVEPPESSEVVTVKLYSEEIPVQGWSFALCHTAQAAEVIEMRAAPELEEIVRGEPPEFVLNDTAPADPFVAVRQAVIFGSGLDPITLGPFPEGLPVLGIRYRVLQEDNLKFCDSVGNIGFDNHVMVDGIGYIPQTRLGAKLVRGALGSRFLRGDADLDGRLNMTDAVVILMTLFLGRAPLPCLDAADANDVGRVDISDPIFILRYLFLGGPEPPSPYPEPGEDLSPQTALGCERGL